MKHTRNMVYQPSDEATELTLYAVNTAVVWRNIEATLRTLQKHVDKGRYTADKAVDAWYHIATMASDWYNREFGYRFTVTERFTAAVDLEMNFREDLGLL